MNTTKHLSLVLLLTLAAGVATAAITHGDSQPDEVAALRRRKFRES
mgnify:CR=1 FL=1